MERGNKILFAIGLIIILSFGYNLLENGYQIKSFFGVISGLTTVWNYGFTGDTNTWKIKPSTFLK